MSLQGSLPCLEPCSYPSPPHGQLLVLWATPPLENHLQPPFYYPRRSPRAGPVFRSPSRARRSAARQFSTISALPPPPCSTETLQRPPARAARSPTSGVPPPALGSASVCLFLTARAALREPEAPGCGSPTSLYPAQSAHPLPLRPAGGVPRRLGGVVAVSRPSITTSSTSQSLCLRTNAEASDAPFTSTKMTRRDASGQFPSPPPPSRPSDQPRSPPTSSR